jgi:hypothetical protein
LVESYSNPLTAGLVSQFQELTQISQEKENEKMFIGIVFGVFDGLNYFLECTTNKVVFGKFAPTSKWT